MAELVALAGPFHVLLLAVHIYHLLTIACRVAEITPVRWRGVTLALVTFSIVPFMPQLLYTILIIRSSTWRYCFLLCALWNLIGMIGLIFCYHPPPRPNAEGLTKMEIIKRINWLGAFLSIVGITLFLVGLQAGGYQYPWTLGKALAPLIVGGLITFVAFPLWEVYGRHPFPTVSSSKIFQGQRVVALAYVVVSLLVWSSTPFLASSRSSCSISTTSIPSQSA